MPRGDNPEGQRQGSQSERQDEMTDPVRESHRRLGQRQCRKSRDHDGEKRDLARHAFDHHRLSGQDHAGLMAHPDRAPRVAQHPEGQGQVQKL